MENKVVVNESHLINMANSIRTLTGSTDSLSIENMIAGLSGAATGTPYAWGSFSKATRGSTRVTHGLNEIPKSILLCRTSTSYSASVTSSSTSNTQNYTVFSSSISENQHIGSYLRISRYYSSSGSSGSPNSNTFFASSCSNNSHFFNSTINNYYITNVTSTGFNTPYHTNGAYFWIALR